MSFHLHRTWRLIIRFAPKKRVGSLSFTNHITLSVVEGESVQVNSASSMPLAPFEEKESRRDVNVRRMGKDNFIRFIEGS
jgi:hypothetical protein